MAVVCIRQAGARMLARPMPAHAAGPCLLIAGADAELGGLAALLAGLGCAVGAAARSGAEAIAAMERIADGVEPRPVLALIDTALPGPMTAAAAAGRIRRRFGIPVIFLCDGALPPPAARAARNAGPAGYVPKPVAPWHLQATIDVALAQHRENEAGERARERGALRRRLAALQGSREETEATLRKQVEDLRSQSVLFNTVLNSMGEGLIVADRDGRYVLANPAMKRLVGKYEPDADFARRARVYGLYYPDRKTPIPPDRLPLARALRGESTDLFDVFIRNDKRPRGVLLSTSARPLRDPAGVLRGGVTVFRDITRLKDTQWKLKESARLLEEQREAMQTVIDSISDGVVAADTAGNLTLFNPSAARILGRRVMDAPPAQRSERYGVYYPDQTTPVPMDALPLTRATRGESSNDEEFFVRRPRRSQGVFISVSGRPLHDGAGTTSGGVVVIRDVTERVHARRTLLQAFAQGRLEVVDTIVHNIGNAINSVAIGVGTIRQELHDRYDLRRLHALAHAVRQHAGDLPAFLQTDPKGRQVLPFLLALTADFAAQNERLTQTVERVHGRVEHIVDLIRTQKSFDGQSMTRKLVGLRRSIDDAARVLAEACAARGIEVTVDCAQAPAEIWIHESRFHEMLVNLMKNAVEAIDELAATGAAQAPPGPPAIRIACYPQDEFLVLDVTDTGIGIADDRRRLVFAPGYTTKEGGTGLGLHSAANFVIGSGGRIRALSAGPGGGTTIRAMLRRAALTAQPP